MVATSCRFESDYRHHVGAKSALLRRLFMPMAKKTSSARSLAPPFQITTAYAGLRFGFGANLEAEASILFRCSIMNEPRFSNCFIEKRGSSYVESLVVRDFPLFVAPDLFFKILQMQKQYFYVGQRFRRYFPKSNKHYSLLVSCNLYKLILQ